MYINLESSDKHSIQAYSEKQIKIDGKLYQTNIVVNATHLVTDWTIENNQTPSVYNLSILFENNPEIILIGSTKIDYSLVNLLKNQLAPQRIALEWMTIGAACRTFNILLSESRAVTLGILFK